MDLLRARPEIKGRQSSQGLNRSHCTIMSATTSSLQAATVSPDTSVARVATGDPELPSYQETQTSAQAPALRTPPENTDNLTTIHKSALLDGRHEWLILRTTTKPRKPESLPVFEEGDIIKGEVEVDPSKKSVGGVKGITVSVSIHRANDILLHTLSDEPHI